MCTVHVNIVCLFFYLYKARAPSSPVVIVGTHIDLLKPEEKEKVKADFKQLICQKFLMGRGPQQLRELGLPRIIDIVYVGCAAGGRGEGIAELRKSLYDIAFTLPVPKGGIILKDLPPSYTHSSLLNTFRCWQYSC